MPSDETDRRAAICELLQQPDPAELLPRGHHRTYEGDEAVQRVQKRRLPLIATMYRLQEREDAACYP